MAIKHHVLTGQQFGSQAQAYLTSQVHSAGADLVRLGEWLAEKKQASVLDLGCGAGHASFVAAEKVAQVTAYDLSEQMLAVVSEAARERGFGNIQVSQGMAEVLPFSDSCFDVVISRYSAHHWHDVGKAMREVKRVLKPGGTFIMMDIVSPGSPLLDTWLQTIEILRDPSHVRNYSQSEWMQFASESGLMTKQLVCERLPLEYASWIARMKTPPVLSDAIRAMQGKAPEEVRQHFAFQDDGSFTSDTIMFMAQTSA